MDGIKNIYCTHLHVSMKILGHVTNIVIIGILLRPHPIFPQLRLYPLSDILGKRNMAGVKCVPSVGFDDFSCHKFCKKCQKLIVTEKLRQMKVWKFKWGHKLGVF